MNYQQNNWTEWLSAVEFQYNNKKYTVTGHTLFKFKFGRHLWKKSSKEVDESSKRSYKKTI